MCAIMGALLWDARPQDVRAANVLLNAIASSSMERGRDGRGFYVNQLSRAGRNPPKLTRVAERALEWEAPWNGPWNFFDSNLLSGTLIGNMRAEPTTEYVEKKDSDDQQPYQCGPWTIVHNGTIANDAELRTHELPTRIDSAAIAELLGADHMLGRSAGEVAQYFSLKVEMLKGSYAILALHDEHPGVMLVACNYRPIWYSTNVEGATYFASARHYFPSSMTAQMVEPYSAWMFDSKGAVRLLGGEQDPKRVLVVCSGGLDSVVAAAWAKAQGYKVTLVHFRYGSRAEGPEIQAVLAVAEYLNVRYWMPAMDIYQESDSPLLQADSEIAGGEAGAEFAHEWVPARNLVMLSIATAMAEARGFDTLVLGNNLEEAGAYPDNEPEFIARFNDLLPFAIGDGKKLRVVMPVGNLMKHEIVALGHQLGAPLELTWSCYRSGEQHCGTCGPCFMRRTAFKINQLPEVIRYADEEK